MLLLQSFSGDALIRGKVRHVHYSDGELSIQNLSLAEAKDVLDMLGASGGLKASAVSDALMAASQGDVAVPSVRAEANVETQPEAPTSAAPAPAATPAPAGTKGRPSARRARTQEAEAAKEPETKEPAAATSEAKASTSAPKKEGASVKKLDPNIMERVSKLTTESKPAPTTEVDEDEDDDGFGEDDDDDSEGRGTETGGTSFSIDINKLPSAVVGASNFRKIFEWTVEQWKAQNEGSKLTTEEDIVGQFVNVLTQMGKKIPGIQKLSDLPERVSILLMQYIDNE